jgi:hypothetical protein
MPLMGALLSLPQQCSKGRWHRDPQPTWVVTFLLTCATTELSLIAMWCLIGATPRGQPWTPAVTLPHGCDGLRARRMAVL